MTSDRAMPPAPVVACSRGCGRSGFAHLDFVRGVWNAGPCEPCWDTDSAMRVARKAAAAKVATTKVAGVPAQVTP